MSYLTKLRHLCDAPGQCDGDVPCWYWEVVNLRTDKLYSGTTWSEKKARDRMEWMLLPIPELEF